MICKHCGSSHTHSRGTHIAKNKIYQQFLCRDCSRWTFAPDIPRLGARILLLDIETSLMEAYIFSPRTDYITSEHVSKDWSILCWNAKWLFDAKIIGEVVTPEEAEKRDDKRILKKLWKLINEADILVHQNGKKFDVPRINWRFLLAGYPRPSYYQQVDTKEVLDKNFGPSYKSQDWITKALGLHQKDDMHLEDWIRCIVGKVSERRKALRKMFVYNQGDVVGLEELYLYVRPWIPSHANLGLYTDVEKDVCPNCSSSELHWNGETYATQLGLYEAFRCGGCGAIGRSTKKKYRIRSVDTRT